MAIKFKDIILIDSDDFEKAVELLEKAGIEVSVPVSRRTYYE